MKKEIRKNEIYLADLGHTIGSEEKGNRPVLIVQNDVGNKYSTTTIILPLTTREENKFKMPTHIQIEPFGNIPTKCVIMAEQIRVIDKRRIRKYLDVLPKVYSKQVDFAMKVAVGLENDWR